MRRRADTGKWEVRWQENGRFRSRSFAVEKEARTFEAAIKEQKRAAAVEADGGKDSAALPAPAKRAETHATGTTRSRLPLLAFLAATGVAVCTLGDALSRSTRSTAQLPFWAGLLIILVPIVFRLCSVQPGR